jgi:hypothetical protein
MPARTHVGIDGDEAAEAAVIGEDYRGVGAGVAAPRPSC